MVVVVVVVVVVVAVVVVVVVVVVVIAVLTTSDTSLLSYFPPQILDETRVDYFCVLLLDDYLLAHDVVVCLVLLDDLLSLAIVMTARGGIQKFIIIGFRQVFCTSCEK